MKTPKEIKQYINRRKRKDAKPNGVIRYIWDALGHKMATNKRSDDAVRATASRAQQE